MADESEDTREAGVEFGSLADALEAESYPLSHEELLDRYGDDELELVDGSARLREVLVTEQEREYEDAEAVRQAIFNMVGSDAIGREGYSDRGGEPTTDDTNGEEESI